MTSKVYSFDVFDTAIFRKVFKPTDLFTVIEKDGYENFCDLRKKAEATAASFDPFYSIDDIYKLLPFDKSVEIQYEFKNCYANKDILEKYNTLRKEGNRCIFISDMYLHKETIQDLLKSCGYENPEVYVSTDIRSKKGDGKLFKDVENIIQEKIYQHHGDNYGSDIIQAHKLGIKTEFLPNIEHSKVELPMIKDTYLKKYVATILNASSLTSLEKLAGLYAPVVVSFTKWVLQHKKGKLWYLARDMYLPYLFTKNILKLDCEYLHASRKSLATLLIKSQYEKMNIKAKQILTPDEYVERSIRDLSVLNHFNSIHDGDTIVDIGYVGTVQLLLQEFKHINLRGLYLQTDHEMEKMDYKMYLTRFILIHQFMVEFVFCSPEDQLVDFNNSGPVYQEDNINRKEYSSKIINFMLPYLEQLKDYNFEVIDIEQLLIYIQMYPDNELLAIYNEPISSNRTQGESIINFNRERIMNGELLECYYGSYARILFKRMLEADPQLAYLKNRLPE